MKYEVRLFVAGYVFTVKVICRNYQEVPEVVLVRNPNAKILSITALYY